MSGCFPSVPGANTVSMCHRRQTCLPIDVTLGLAPHIIKAPNTSKFVQRWESSQNRLRKKAKESQHHKKSRSTCSTYMWHTKPQNWLPWMYQNFSLQAGTRLPNIWDTWAGLYAVSSLCNASWGSTVWIHSLYTITCLWSTTYFGIEGNFFNVVFVVDLLDGGELDQRVFGLSTTASPEKKEISKAHIPIETLGVCSSPTQKAR